jgi:LPXTG-motif cell wall-anchored protein
MTLLRRLLVLLVLTIATSFALVPGSLASASSYPPDEPKTVTVLNPIGPPGYPVRVVVDGCIPGETVVITLGDQTVEAICDDETLQVVVDIPAPSVPGVYDVVVTCPDRDNSPTIISPIQVVAVVPVTTVPPPATQPLPRTGSDSIFGSMWLAAGLLVAGGGMVVVARIRSAGEAPSGTDA